MDWINILFSTSGYPARWTCGTWTAFWGWLHITSDMVIFMAYMGIPIAILYYKKQFKQFKVNTILVMFALFIAFCGLTHLNEAIIFWHPYYNFAGVIKFGTAVVSLGTLIIITLNLPEIVALVNEKQTSKDLKDIIESCPQGILIVNSAGKIVFSNKLISKNFGYSQDEIQNKDIKKILPTFYDVNHIKFNKSFLKELTHKKMDFGRDLFAFDNNNQKFPVEVGLSPIEFDGNKCILCSIVDITERKKKEQELQQLNASLKQSNDELEKFAYVASHDLKEPLRGIHNYSVMLNETAYDLLDNESKYRLAKLPKLAKRLEQQINSLLEYSRLDKQELKLTEIDLNQVLRDSREMLDHIISKHHVTININDTLPMVFGDNNRLLEVFTNIITNSIKYNDSDHPVIEVGTLKLDNGNAGLSLIYIKDNGIGIAQDHFDRIFTLFKRLHSKNRYGGGTGVGLTIVKKIIEKHGGEIWVESEPGHGTTFFFTLKTRRE